MKCSLRVLAIALSVGAVAMPAAPALAQAVLTPYSGAVPVPPIIAQAEGARQVGLIGGLSAWTIPGQEAVFIIAPDGQSTIIGYVFGPDGTDIGSQLTGSAPVDLSEILKAQADIEAQALLVPAPAPLTDVPATNVPGGASLGVSVSPEAQTPRTEMDAHLDDLTQQLDAATTPEEFKAALQGWADDLVAQAEAVEAGQVGTAQPSVPEPAPFDAPAPVVPLPPGQAPAASQAPVQVQQQSVLSAEELLEQARTNSFWFEVGAYDAPTVYAFIDPDCPFCARAMLNLQEEVEGGKLKLRVMLTPFLHDASIGLAGAILTTTDPENPASVAFWKHELERAYGVSSLEPLADLSKIPGELVDGMQANIDLMKAAGIAGVPYFVYATEGGVKTHFGVAQAGQFADALPDVAQQQ